MDLVYRAQGEEENKFYFWATGIKIYVNSTPLFPDPTHCEGNRVW
jgi:hypothetical protein